MDVDSVTPDALELKYEENYGRLQQIKSAHGPNNIFRMNKNISPARSRER